MPCLQAPRLAQTLLAGLCLSSATVIKGVRALLQGLLSQSLVNVQNKAGRQQRFIKVIEFLLSTDWFYLKSIIKIMPGLLLFKN